MSLTEDIKREEGFRSMPYKDHLGFDTLGYGTKLPLLPEEAELILEYRLNNFKNGVKSSLYYLDIDDKAWDILYHMAYQLGLAGVLKFKKMLKALEEQDYKEAANQILDSKLAKQTPNRAKRLSDRMRNIK